MIALLAVIVLVCVAFLLGCLVLIVERPTAPPPGREPRPPLKSKTP